MVHKCSISIIVLRTSEKISPKQILGLRRTKKILKIRHLHANLLATGFYGKIVIGYLYPITIEDFLFGWSDSYVPEI